MDAEQKSFLENGEAAVERATNGTYSKQPRFNGNIDGFFNSIMRFRQLAFMNQPDYKADSRIRDKWLRDFWRMEPHLKGVVNSAVAIDKNRGWSLTGGRNQVSRYTTILHSAQNGAGWRNYASLLSLAFYTTDINAISEIGRDGIDGPMRGLYHVDSTRCLLTADSDQPLKYYPPRGKIQRWMSSDFFRVASLPSDDETYNGLGLCAVSRCLELVQLMLAVYEHDREMLGARAPRGLLLLQNINQDQWEQAMTARDARLDTNEQIYYGAVAVLAQMGVDQIDAKLVALSQLPANFDIKVFTDLLMYGYALAFGYDPSEFWPVQFGSLGRGTEGETQARKASNKGGLDFILGLQEQLQRPDVLPPTLQFEFEQRDEAGDLTAANLAKAKVGVIRDLYAPPPGTAEGLIDRDEARQMLAQQGVIPAEWTEAEEDVTSTDTSERRLKHLQQRALELPQVRAAIARYPDEPIVRYDWPLHREVVLWRRGGDAMRRSVWLIEPPLVQLPLGIGDGTEPAESPEGIAESEAQE